MNLFGSAEFRNAKSTLSLSSLLVSVYIVSWILMTLAINDTRISVSSTSMYSRAEERVIILKNFTQSKGCAGPKSLKIFIRSCQVADQIERADCAPQLDETGGGWSAIEAGNVIENRRLMRADLEPKGQSSGLAFRARATDPAALDDLFDWPMPARVGARRSKIMMILITN